MFSYDKLWKCFPAALAALFLSAPAAAESGKFDIGVTGGWSKTEAGLSATGVPSADVDDSGGSFGVVARYTVPMSDSDTFAGVSISWQTDPLDLETSGTLNGTRWTSRGEADWSADLLARIGHDYGTFAPYVAGGVSMIRGTIEGSFGDLNAKDEQTHLGWKIAVGTDVELSGNWGMFVQGEYADYAEKTYGQGLETEVETLAVRLGLVYRF